MIEHACRTMTGPYNDLIEGMTGCLIPQETEDERFADIEFVINGKLHIEEVPECLLRQATSEEAKQFINDTWDVYDKMNWN